MKKILWIASIVAIVLLAYAILKSIKYSSVERDCSYKLEAFDFHYKKEVDSPNILMLGNSLIKFGAWDSLLQRKDVINRGISGDKLSCICNRLGYLKNTTAKICFIEGGINDFPTNDIEALFGYYKQIVAFWKAEGKIPVINLILYVSPKALGKDMDMNKSIFQLNNLLKAFATQEKIDCIDMNQQLADNGKFLLKDEYTPDGIHLTGAAYGLWAKEINKILKKKQL